MPIETSMSILMFGFLTFPAVRSTFGSAIGLQVLTFPSKLVSTHAKAILSLPEASNGVIFAIIMLRLGLIRST
jgi:hypothetical protein